MSTKYDCIFVNFIVSIVVVNLAKRGRCNSGVYVYVCVSMCLFYVYPQQLYHAMTKIAWIPYDLITK